MKTKVKARDPKSVMQGAERRLHKTCDQMEQLQSRISLLKARHQRAIRRRPSAAESLGVQLCVMEGVYAMYYTYAETQCQQLAKALTPRDHSQQ